MTGDDVASVDGLFSGEEVLLLESRDFFIPNIDEKALLIVFLVFRASWPKNGIEYNFIIYPKGFEPFFILIDYFSIHKSIYLIDLLLKRQVIRCFLFSTVDLDS